mmetsp:Transcript_108646/g.272276  ORF Transcript_108646/g.272276 Transcript_108646/m.272276 type:complete len:378 (-) Transcript_108646:205-1338(-)
MRVVHLTDAPAEHDGLHPLEALPGGHTMPECSRPAADERLAELVAVVAGAVRAIDQDLEGGSHGAWILKRLILPGQRVARQVQVAHGIAGDGSDDQRTLPRALTVTDPAACTCLRAWEWCNPAREVVRLDRKRDIEVALDLAESARLGGFIGGLFREEGDVLEAAQGAAVVLEGNGAVARVLLERPLHPLEKRFGHHLAVDDNAATEEPMPAVLRVALSQVEALDSRRVPLQLVLEDPHVVVDVLRVITQALLLTQLLESFAPLLQHRHSRPFLRFRVLLERGNAIRIYAFRHAVVHEQREFLRRCRGAGPLDVVPAGLLDACDLYQAHCAANRHSVRGPRACELLPWGNLQDAVPIALGRDERLYREIMRLERLLQ